MTDPKYSRRAAWLRIDPNDIVFMLRSFQDLKDPIRPHTFAWARRVYPEVPADAKIVSVREDCHRLGLMLLIESEEFEPVSYGGPFPFINETWSQPFEIYEVVSVTVEQVAGDVPRETKGQDS